MATIPESAKRELNDLYHRYLQLPVDASPNDSVLLCFTGAISQGKVDALLSLAETAILDNGSKRKVMKRVCTILIESLQNISIHGTKDTTGQSKSFVVLKQTSKSLQIVTGNLILSEDANLLAFKLEELNKLNEAELRKLYIETLCNENFSYKGGAGLGFLTIAKKASEPIAFEIHKLSDQFSFFINEITVDRS